VDSLVLLNSRNVSALIICQTACGFANEMSELASSAELLTLPGPVQTAFLNPNKE
jgi:hypothetical protein